MNLRLLSKLTQKGKMPSTALLSPFFGWCCLNVLLSFSIHFSTSPGANGAHLKTDVHDKSRGGVVAEVETRGGVSPALIMSDGLTRGMTGVQPYDEVVPITNQAY